MHRLGLSRGRFQAIARFGHDQRLLLDWRQWESERPETLKPKMCDIRRPTSDVPKDAGVHVVTENQQREVGIDKRTAAKADQSVLEACSRYFAGRPTRSGLCPSFSRMSPNLRA